MRRSRGRRLGGGPTDRDGGRPGADMSEPRGIIGVGQTPYRKRNPDRSAGELVRLAVTEALADASIDLADIDFVVGGVAPDALSGVADIDKAAISLPGTPYLHVN